MSIEYRIVHDLDDLKKIVELEIEIWKLDSVEAAPTHLLHTLTHNGGVLIAAYDGDKPVGLCLGFAARRDGEWFIWSHMAGVHPQFQGQGIGRQLKLMQRKWAQDQGYKSIRWTFDPLQRGNANFNMHVLGATANRYHVNYYGEMTDVINAGLPSDRLEVIWPTVNAHEPKKQSTSGKDQNLFLLCAGSHIKPIINEIPPETRRILVEIPPDLSVLKRQSSGLALEWRLTTRKAFQTAFSSHYAVIDFVEVSGRYAYMLEAPQPWFLYVVQCNDHTLYTGVTNNLERRVNQHNAGKGAAYTAARRPVTYLASWRFPNQSTALKAEAAFKKQSRNTKLGQIQSRQPYQNGAFVEIT